MSALSGWILSITCVVILSVLCEFVLPEGQMNKYIRVIFSFIMLLVIILPLPKLLGEEFDLSKFLSSSSVELQEEYLEQVNLDKITYLNQELGHKLDELGFDKLKIYINADITAEKLEILGVLIDVGQQGDLSTEDKKKILNLVKKEELLKNVEVEFYE